MFGGVPLHPLLVHAPIGLLLFGTFLILLSFKWSNFRLFALVTLVTGFLSGVVAYISGEGAEEYAETNLLSVTEAMIESHEQFALFSLVAFGMTIILFIIGFRAKGKAWRILSFITALIGCILLAYTGHLGGQMVYL
ncbi:hypothetical protein A6395_02980 [Exiguobacterium sp. SH31]|uniref:DUF2231 domain-containing protein n=1 Tax=unclassified Exiguobacterium TaxID=2644629 RepID=UPI0008BF40F1|nr:MULTISPECIES: DUF2231 domain-containing protein [unclassified Exiguobacterium]OGX80169.1 hypothetical protein A6395_02980 [Exiguobacterium sp. SH31]TCI73202.1 hypothetical protein EVJ22_02055 [Exiguobacterium sp. SH0S7]